MVAEGLGRTQAPAAFARHGEPDVPPPSGGEALLALEDVSKRFPGVVANDQVTFAVGEREIHALLGENGAGKSTLVKLIYGLLRPDAGRLSLAGKPYAPSSPADARAHGVGMVFQHFSLFDGLTVAQNIALGMHRQRADRALRQRIAEVSAAYGLKLDPGRQVGTLSVGERQRVEIVRCLLQTPRLIIMDEPTSVLTPQEVAALFAILRRLVGEGCSILYISHKLEEVRALASRATILRAGRVVASCEPARESTHRIAALMLGGALPPVPSRRSSSIGPVRLRLNALSLAKPDHFGVALDGIELNVRGGEIVGLAGVAGNGQVELMDALIGERLAAAEQAIEIDGVGVGLLPPAPRRRLGLCAVREERLAYASVPEMSLWENGVLTAHRRLSLSRHGLIDKPRALAFARRVAREFDVRAPSGEAAAQSLSGGNLQKFLVGREVLQAPAVLIVAQPTWGVDIGAAASIQARLRALAKTGAAVLVVSQDLDELFAIADRIAVIAHGRLSRPQPIETITAASLGLRMGGLALKEAADLGAGDASPEPAHG
jgi:general nucleoside transport system ATP-binding protein